MNVASTLLFALLALTASASEKPRPLVEHSIRVDGHVKCAGVPVENATVNLVFVVPNPDKKSTNDDLDKLIYHEPSDSLDYPPPSDSEYPGNSTDSEPGEVPTGFDYPDNGTDIEFFNLTNVDPVGRGASLTSEVNASVNGIVGSDDYYAAEEDNSPPSEFEDVLESTLTSVEGVYHVGGKILYAPGDDTWKLHLNIEHSCFNGTIIDDFPYVYKQAVYEYYDIPGEGKQQFQIDVELSVVDSDYKVGVSTDY